MVSSYLVDSEQQPVAGGRNVQGLLSVFDVLYSAAPGSERYDIVLHGTQPTPAVAHCLEALRMAGDADAGSAAASGKAAPARGEPLVVLGCHDAVYAARLFVDDTASLGLAAVEAAMSSLRCSTSFPQ